MARPQTISDEHVMEAARLVIGRRGYSGFTLAEVAAELGVSRTAVILRFKSTQALRLRITANMTERFERELSSIPVSRSGDGLIAFAAAIGALARSRAAYVSMMTISHGNLADPELLPFEKRRAALLRKSITARMPRTSVTQRTAVSAFKAHIAGCIIEWASESRLPASQFLAQRTKEWLQLACIPFTLD